VSPNSKRTSKAEREVNEGLGRADALASTRGDFLDELLQGAHPELEPGTLGGPPVQQTPHVPERPHVPEASLVSGTPDPVSETPPVRELPHACQTGVEIASAFAKMPLEWLDVLCADTDPYTQAVYAQLLRLSWGHRRNWCVVGFPRLAERANVSESQRAPRPRRRRHVERRPARVGPAVDRQPAGRNPYP
jgi:hypothetical protein